MHILGLISQLIGIKTLRLTNNTDEIEVLIWNVHAVEVKQNMHNQRHEEKNMKVEYHRDVQRETYFRELRMEDG